MPVCFSVVLVMFLSESGLLSRLCNCSHYPRYICVVSPCIDKLPQPSFFAMSKANYSCRQTKGYARPHMKTRRKLPHFGDEFALISPSVPSLVKLVVIDQRALQLLTVFVCHVHIPEL